MRDYALGRGLLSPPLYGAEPLLAIDRPPFFSAFSRPALPHLRPPRAEVGCVDMNPQSTGCLGSDIMANRWSTLPAATQLRFILSSYSMRADPSQHEHSDSSNRSPKVVGLALPGSVRNLLKRLRGQVRRRVLVDGLLLAALSVLLVFWFGALIDYAPVTIGANETPRWMRIGLLALMAIGVAWATVWRLGRRMFARLSDRSLALLIERHFPALNSELVTVVELSDKPAEAVSNPQAYRAMLSRVHESVSQRVPGLDLRGLLNWKPVWMLAAATVALAALTIGVALAKPDWFRLWSSRLFALSDQRWPRLVRLRAEGVQLQLPTFTGQLFADRLVIPFIDGAVQVPRGGSAALQVLADKRAAKVPDLCTLFYQIEDGSRGRANMRRLGGNSGEWQTFVLDGPPLDELAGNVTFDVVGGDARLDDLRLEVIDPAVVTEMKLELAYPAYLLSSRRDLPPRELVEFRSGQRIAEGTHVTLKGTASGTLREVQYVVRTPQAGGSAQAASAAAAVARSPADPERATSTEAAGSDSGAPEIQILTVKPDGNHFEIPLGAVRDTAVVEIRLLDQFGLAADQIPRYVITVQEDAPPEVETRLLGIGTAVTPKAVLPIVGTARDDHGLARVWTTIVLNENPPLEIETPIDADGKLEPRIDLLELAEKQAFEVTTDSTLGLVVSAADRFDLGGIKHVGSGQPFQLAVVTEDKLLVLLDRQELELRQRLELIVSELTQLRDVLRELSRAPASVVPADTSANLESRASAGSLLGAAISTNGRLQHDRTSAAATVATAAWAPQAGAVQDGAEENPADPQREQRLILLRAQQSVLQADKSQQELIGVATRVEDIRLQLINNRIDNIDRQTRLHDRVYLPLMSVLEKEMEDLRNRLGQLQTASMSPQGSTAQAAAAADANDRVLVALDAIIANLLDLASYNEIIDLVRGILDDEERLLDETQKKQKQGILDLLKQ